MPLFPVFDSSPCCWQSFPESLLKVLWFAIHSALALPLSLLVYAIPPIISSAATANPEMTIIVVIKSAVSLIFLLKLLFLLIFLLFKKV